MRKRAYRSTAVKFINVSEVVSRLSEGPVALGLDIGKAAILAVVRDATGHFERPWKIRNPHEIQEFVMRAKQLSQERPLVIAMEPTGTYGDPLRQALTDADLVIHRVGGKASSDYKEIFDGVPSAHDGKDAAVVAELAAIGKSSPWPNQEPTSQQAEMAGEVSWLDSQQDILQVWLGRLEGLLARHWPELTGLLKLNSGTLVRMLAHYGTPAAVAADPQAADQLARWGGPLLRPDKIAAVLESARITTGVRMQPATIAHLQHCAEAALAARREIQTAKQKLKLLSKEDEVIQAMAQVVGIPTACVLRVTLGAPQDYHCGEAYRKAMGLNLKECSSGKHQGKLKITKRGPSLARRWLFFAALRMIQKPPVQHWHEAKKRKDQGRGMAATVGVMRKMALAIFAVAVRGEKFSADRLFPGKPLPRRAEGASGATS
jgi:transposase